LLDPIGKGSVAEWEGQFQFHDGVAEGVPFIEQRVVGLREFVAAFGIRSPGAVGVCGDDIDWMARGSVSRCSAGSSVAESIQVCMYFIATHFM
jgi:hypothetical protein